MADKIDDIYKVVQEIKIELARSLVHQEQHRVELDEHRLMIDNLKTYRDKTNGIIATLGIFFGAIATYIVTHFFSK